MTLDTLLTNLGLFFRGDIVVEENCRLSMCMYVGAMLFLKLNVFPVIYVGW